MMSTVHVDRGLRLIGFIVFLLLWFAIATYAGERVLPGPVTVISHFVSLLVDGEILTHLFLTLARVLASFLIALAVGAVIGIAMGHFRHLNALLDSMLVIFLNIPALVTIILCYLWFGLNEIAAITAVIINKLPVVIVTMREGARAVDQHLLEVGTVYRLPLKKRIQKIYLPQLTPYLMASARSGLALIWKIVLVVELLGRSDGMGFKLGSFFQFFDITGILAYTLAFVLIILFIEAAIMRPLEARMNRWRKV